MDDSRADLAHSTPLARLKALLLAQWRQLLVFQKSERSWQMPLAAALSSGLPLVAGAWFGQIGYGLVGSIGGLAFLYLPVTPLSHRMVVIMACSFGMLACYAFGLASQLVPPLILPTLVCITVLVTMMCRLYNVGPPGSLFFVMVASIGAYSPVAVPEWPRMVGLFALGCMVACLVGFVYSLFMLRKIPPKPPYAGPPPAFDFVVVDALIIGLAVGVSLAVAQAFQLEKPYWVPVSCLAVIQGASLRAVWTKQLHRVIGTAAGLLLSWGLLSLPLGQWVIAMAVMLLTFLIESLIVRHYALAATLITPLTILLAEAATLGHTSAALLIRARFLDTVLGCAIGLGGAACLHSPRLRHRLGVLLRRMLRIPLPGANP